MRVVKYAYNYLLQKEERWYIQTVKHITYTLENAHAMLQVELVKLLAEYDRPNER